MKNGRKHNSGKKSTVDGTLEPTQPSGIKQCREGHSTFEPGPAGNTVQIEMFHTLILQTPINDTSNSLPHQGMSNSSRSRWKHAEQTVNFRVWINLVQHTQPSNIMAMTQWQETLTKTKPGHQLPLALKKLKVTFSSWPPQRRTVLKDLENKCKIAMK